MGRGQEEAGEDTEASAIQGALRVLLECDDYPEGNDDTLKNSEFGVYDMIEFAF